jgi:phage gp29-like protein
MPALASMTPQYVESILRGALTGDHVQQWELFDMMLETWPELGGCVQELTEGVMSRKLVFSAYAEEGEAPSQTALEKQRLASTALRGMAPDVNADENDLDDTLKDILDGWFRGVVCLENDWHVIAAGKLGRILAPRATFWAHPSYFAWGVDGRLGLANTQGVQALPPHKFLVGIHKAKSGSALGGAVLRALAWWWTASNFASDWVLNLAQLFGLPFRWANYDPNAPQQTVDAICNMLQNMGSAGWAAFPAGTTLELKDAGAKGDNSPQADLLDRADRYARMLILGQTMSGSQDSSKGGGKAFGSVEANVKTARIDAAAKYACKVLNGQLIPSIIELNYGNRDECPSVSMITDADAGKEEADRDKVLSEMMPIPLSYLRQKYNIPEPAAGEETTKAKAETLKTETLKEDSLPDAPLASKLAALLEIEDEALFAKQLATLTDSLK